MWSYKPPSFSGLWLCSGHWLSRLGSLDPFVELICMWLVTLWRSSWLEICVKWYFKMSINIMTPKCNHNIACLTTPTWMWFYCIYHTCMYILYTSTNPCRTTSYHKSFMQIATKYQFSVLNSCFIVISQWLFIGVARVYNPCPWQKTFSCKNAYNVLYQASTHIQSHEHYLEFHQCNFFWVVYSLYHNELQ